MLLQAVLAVVYGSVWFLVAVWFARTWPSDRCPPSCRYTLDRPYNSRRVYHSEECETRPTMIHPAGACFAALLWPVFVPYRTVAWAAAYQRKPRLLTEREIAAIERECEIGMTGENE